MFFRYDQWDKKRFNPVPQPNNERPFNSELEPVEDDELTSDSIGLIKGNPDLVVRAVEPDKRLPIKADGDTEYIIQYAQLGKRLLRELEADYNFRVAPTELVVAKSDDGKESVYCFTEKIDGQNLSNLSDDLSNNRIELSEIEGVTLAAELDNLYLNLINYLISKHEARDFYLADINDPAQFVYGQQADKNEKHIYLVDTDILLEPYNGDQDLKYDLLKIINNITRWEAKLRIKLDKSRRILADSITNRKIPQRVIDDLRNLIANFNDFII